ncbi:TPA: hypothetical protein ACJEU7_003027 [Acinetobacter baumannii]|uniref:hypothetical protein n=1 Tax=Acinetobacter baumannii TaxID=470 RepID=UPI00124A90F7|nr:hypothetical protein [Acinetobacter baumannii]KAB1664887.1 hypothetical protein F8B05_20230 [Acinetobacter baumannii]MCX3035250.1 hypothetical protein [Acinetobacter baumannii]
MLSSLFNSPHSLIILGVVALVVIFIIRKIVRRVKYLIFLSVITGVFPIVSGVFMSFISKL